MGGRTGQPTILNTLTVNINCGLKVCLLFRRCAPIAGTDVRVFTSETQLLKEWTEFLQELDPDVVTGYNIVNFDLPYLLNRAKTLKVSSC